MELTIEQYTQILDKHPFNTFGKMEIESFMWWFLIQCVDAGDINHIVETKHNHDHLCDRGILIKEEGHNKYRMTDSTKQILHQVYKREFLEPSDFEL